MGDIDQVGEAEILYLPGAVPIPGVVPFAVEAVLSFLKMEIFGYHAWIGIDRGVFVVTWHIEGAVIHDIVEIDADAKTVSDFHHVDKFGLGAVAGADRVALIFGTKIEGIPKIVTDRETS